jgi:hypothetical protein
MDEVRNCGFTSALSLPPNKPLTWNDNLVGGGLTFPFLRCGLSTSQLGPSRFPGCGNPSIDRIAHVIIPEPDYNAANDRQASIQRIRSAQSSTVSAVGNFHLGVRKVKSPKALAISPLDRQTSICPWSIPVAEETLRSACAAQKPFHRARKAIRGRVMSDLWFGR